ncbi:MAG TPA: TonB C-terminal domain-containing protein, partial [Burkholderiales bacterium]|nr:TonB C-terminal domain-containing protein [Burkholderiales bacterium]
MTEQASERAAEENQREAERAALRNVRAALDEIGRKEESSRKLGRSALVVAAAMIVVLIAAAALLTLNHKQARQQRDAPQRAAIAALQYSSQVEKRIKALLAIPAGVPDTASVLVELSLSQAGAVEDSRILRSSGISTYDEAVRRA